MGGSIWHQPAAARAPRLCMHPPLHCEHKRRAVELTPSRRVRGVGQHNDWIFPAVARGASAAGATLLLAYHLSRVELETAGILKTAGSTGLHSSRLKLRLSHYRLAQGSVASDAQAPTTKRQRHSGHHSCGYRCLGSAAYRRSPEK
eukprot:927776-Pleurochrysis_carterae.AAC.1